MNLEIAWRAKRMDEDIAPDLPTTEIMVEIDGRIMFDGTEAGTADGFYLLAEEPASSEAFFEFWDMEQWTCEIHGELITPGGEQFREPLARLLGHAAGIVCIRHLALYPPFRGRGLGREVMRRMVGDWVNEDVGVVILNAEPLQHRHGAYDNYDEEVRELPHNDPEEDRARLTNHLRGWGFHLVAGTRWMVAPPKSPGPGRATGWPPVPIH